MVIKKHPQLVHRDYNPEDLRAFHQMGLSNTLASNPAMRFDSTDDAGIFFARQLDYIKTQLYNMKYPKSHALSLFPLSYGANQGAQTVSYRGFDRVGESKIISAEGNDIPRVALTAIEKTAPVRTIGNFFSYSIEQLEASRFGGLPLEMELAKTSRLSIDQELNRIAWVGDETNGLQGVLTQGNGIPTMAAPNQIVNMTPSQILAFVRDMITFTAKETFSVERPDTWAVPTDVFIHLTNTMVESSTGGTNGASIATWIKENTSRLVNIIEVPDLNPGSDVLKGTPYESTGASFVYKKDGSGFAIEVPLPFDQTPPQPSELSFRVYCRARTAGALIYYPLSALIVTGV